MRRGIRVTDSRYNGPANTGRTRSAARTVPKGREGRRDKRKESSYASRDADTATVRETRTVRRTRRERRPRVQVKTGFSPWHAPFARSAGAEREGGKGSTGFPYVGMTMAESEGRRWASSFDDARMSAERIGNVKMKEGAIRETSVRVCICGYIRERRKENKR